MSVVVPVFGCAECLTTLCERLAQALEATTFELVLIDDRSPDGSWEIITNLAQRFPVRGRRLSRNFGQQAAIAAGLAAATGEWIAVMDCDLQDAPEDVPRLLAKAREGYDMVLARRRSRRQAAYRRFASHLYFKLLGAMTSARLELNAGAFSILSRKVADGYLTLEDTSRHYLLILNWLGFNHATIDVEHAERTSGRSAYSLRSLVAHALNGLVFETTALLRWIIYAGLAIALAGVGLAIGLVCLALLATPPPGWTSLAVLTLVIGGAIIISTGVAGLYVGKIFDQVKRRPLYVVDEDIESPRLGRESYQRSARWTR